MLNILRTKKAPVGRGQARAPAGTRIYAVGDIHGRADLLFQLHDMIAADAGPRPGVACYVVYLGDYVDRGPDVRAVLETLSAGRLEGFTAMHLMGNHEEEMLAFLDGESDGYNWLQFGGRSTLLSYGVRLDETFDIADRLVDARQRLRQALPPAHEAFLRNLKLSLSAGDYLFVHAGIRPGVPLAAQNQQDLLWIRDDFLNSDADHGQIVVHGHTISKQPEVRRNRIGIDTGAYASGRLTCLVLERDGQRFLST